MSTAAQYGQRSTLGALDQNLHINIEDQIVKYPDPRRELLKRLNGKNFKNEVKSHKYEWSTRDNRAIKTTLSIAIADSATSLVVADPGVLNVDDMIRLPNGELAVVESVSGGISATFRVIAGTQAAHDIGDEVIVVGGATAQGKDADNMVTTGFSDLFNYTQNFEDVIELSDLEHNALIRGEENSGELIARKQMELSEKLQNTLIIGQRTKDDARKTTTMGGLKYMIDTYAPAANSMDFGGSSTWSADSTVEGKLDDALDIISNKAFEKPVMYVGAKFMRKFKFVQDEMTRTTLREKARGIGVVKTYLSHLFGEIDVVLLQERAGLMDDLVFLVDESMIGYKAHKGLGWQTYPLARTGQSFRWQVAGHYTFKMDVPEACVYLYNLGV